MLLETEGFYSNIEKKILLKWTNAIKREMPEELHGGPHNMSLVSNT